MMTDKTLIFKPVKRHPPRFVPLLFLIPVLLFFFGPGLSTAAEEPPVFEAPKPETSVSVAPQNVNPGDDFTLKIEVTVPAGHHGYLDAGPEGFLIPLSFNFSDLEKRGVTLESMEKPEGTLDEEVKAQSFHGKGIFTFRGRTSPDAQPGELPGFTMRYQFCNDETKMCFPPSDLSLDIPLNVGGGPGSGSVPPAAGDRADEKVTFSEKLGRALSRYFENPFFALFLSFLGGLLAAATPCVYPLIPITVQIIAARGGGGKTVRHSFAYFLGIVAMYTILGLIAGLTGGGFNQIMQIPWVILCFAVLFAVLALSMFDLFVLQIPGSMNFQSKAEKKSGVTGTFLMGLGAGLVVSPCVGPIVIAILVKVTEKIALLQQEAVMAQTAIDFFSRLKYAGYGGLLMAGFGVGIGIPFLVVGLITQKMPKPGNWMVYVKSAVGLLILYFAYIYYQKAMGTWGVTPALSNAMLWGVIFILLGVFLGAFRPLADKNPAILLFKKGGGVILLVIGVCFLYNGVRQSGILLPLPAGPGSPAGAVSSAGDEAVEVHGNLTWQRNYETALKLAAETGKPLFLDFYADWCANCKAFGKLAVENDVLNTALQKAVIVKIYDTDPVFQTFREDPRFPELKIGLPFFTILLPDETMVWKGTDYRAIETFKTELERAEESLQGGSS